jgi:hypothetical protein
MINFQITEENKMSNYILAKVGRWKNVIALLALVVTCYLLATGSARSDGQQQEIIKLLTSNQKNVMAKQDRQDTINTFVLAGLKNLTEEQARNKKESDRWVIEQIRILKLHDLQPYEWEKIEVKPRPSMKPFGSIAPDKYQTITAR